MRWRVLLGGHKGRPDTTCVLQPLRRFRLETGGDAVDAITLAGGRWPVGKDMAEVAAAARAVHFGAAHAVGRVLRYGGGPRNGIVEARPAGAALELGPGLEQRLAAADAHE